MNGPRALQDEDAWVPVLVKRTSDVINIASGISQVFVAIIKLFFGAVQSTDLSLGGMELQCHDGSRVRFYCSLAMFLQDGAAHKNVFHCKGDAGSKLCMLCKNLYAEKSSITDEEAFALPISSTFMSTLQTFANFSVIAVCFLFLFFCFANANNIWSCQRNRDEV